jgi:hypothetical protein
MRFSLFFLFFLALIPFRSEGNADCVRRNMASLLTEAQKSQPVSYEEFLKSVAEFKKAEGKPKFIMHMKGEFIYVKEPIPQVKLHSGLHSNEAVEFLKKMRPDIAREIQVKTIPGGVQVVTLPMSVYEESRFTKVYQSTKVVNGKEIIFTKKTLFPKDWPEDEIIHAVNKIKRNHNNVVRREANAIIMEGKYKGIKIRLVVADDEIVTAFPLVD